MQRDEYNKIRRLKEEGHQIMESIMLLGVPKHKIYSALSRRLGMKLHKVHFGLINDEKTLKRAIVELKSLQFKWGVKLGKYKALGVPISKKQEKSIKYQGYKKKMLDPDELRKALANRKPLTVWQKLKNLLNHLDLN